MMLYMRPLAILLSLHWVFVSVSAIARTVVDRTVVTVNDEVILESDVAEFHQKIQSKSFQELFGGINPEALNDPKKTLQLLVEEKIIDQQVKKLDLKATDPEIDAQVRAILKRNNIAPTQLAERLKQLGASLTEYREGIRRQLERKNLIDREIRPTLEVSEEQVRHYYLRNMQNASSEKEFKLAHILIPIATGGIKAASTRAASLYETLKKSPEKFEERVKEYSGDPATSAAGGFLGVFSAGSMAKEFRDVIPKLETGQITPPIKTGAGFHIVKILDVHISDYASLSKEKRDQVRNQLLEQEMDRKMQLWLERKKAESYIRLSGEKNES